MRAGVAKEPNLRRAVQADLDAILELERACFQDYRQASQASLKRSIARSSEAARRMATNQAGKARPGKHAKHASSPSPQRQGQSVWVIDAPGGGLSALLVLWHFPNVVRVYDVATHPDARGQGLGGRLMRHAEQLAREAGAAWVSLEAEEQDPRLVRWYEGQGFRTVARLPDFYHEGCSALRMRKRLDAQP